DLFDLFFYFFFFSSRRRHTRSYGDWSSDVCSSDLMGIDEARIVIARHVISHTKQPLAHDRLRQLVKAHLFQAGVLAQVKNRKSPDVGAVACIVAVDLGWTHSAVAGEVVRQDAVALEPAAYPLGMIANRS